MGGKCSAKYGCVKDGDYCLGGLRGGGATLFSGSGFLDLVADIHIP